MRTITFPVRLLSQSEGPEPTVMQSVLDSRGRNNPLTDVKQYFDLCAKEMLAHKRETGRGRAFWVKV